MTIEHKLTLIPWSTWCITGSAYNCCMTGQTIKQDRS